MDFKVCHWGLQSMPSCTKRYAIKDFKVCYYGYASCIFSSCVCATRKLQKLQSPVGDWNFEAFLKFFYKIFWKKILKFFFYKIFKKFFLTFVFLKNFLKFFFLDFCCQYHLLLSSLSSTIVIIIKFCHHKNIIEWFFLFFFLKLLSCPVSHRVAFTQRESFKNYSPQSGTVILKLFLKLFYMA